MVESLRVRVSEIVREAEGINSYVLEPTDGGLPPFTPGAHVQVTTPGGLVRPYSLAGAPADAKRWIIAVQHEPAGRGGSRSMHEGVRVGTTLALGAPRNQFPLRDGSPALLVAGGIGITPLLSMARSLDRAGRAFSLVYLTRGPEKTAFKEALAAPNLARRVRIHHDGGDPAKALDLKALLATRPDGAHLYCCGPAGLMAAVKQAAWESWPVDAVHFESFSAAPEAAAEQRLFKLKVRSTGEELEVPPGKSALRALLDAGYFVPSSCEEGTCGTCLTGVVEGEPEHRDACLTEEERARGMTVCCSRARGGSITVDL